jgi:hypothetical protein
MRDDAVALSVRRQAVRLPDGSLGATPRGLGSAVPSLGRRPLSLTVGLAITLALGFVGWRVAQRMLDDYLATTPPRLASAPTPLPFGDYTPVRLTVSADWEKIPYVTTRDAVRSDATLWQRLRLEDWDSVPSPLRTEALEAMIARHRELLTRPEVWDRMTPHDWDRVPHPMRVLAFSHMAAYWRGYHQVGDAHGIPRQFVADTLAAIVMTESWFEHRAVNTNPWGNRDLGLAQASDGARAHLAALFEAGDVDFVLTDRQYFNPWYGTRFVAVWMKRLLATLGGDLDLAIRAYHRGIGGARRGEGDEYLAMVVRRRDFLRAADHPGAWGVLRARDQEILAADWPWLETSAGRPARTDPWRPRLDAQPALYLQTLARLPRRHDEVPRVGP